jgi:hypothetical protein
VMKSCLAMTCALPSNSSQHITARPVRRAQVHQAGPPALHRSACIRGVSRRAQLNDRCGSKDSGDPRKAEKGQAWCTPTDMTAWSLALCPRHSR